MHLDIVVFPLSTQLHVQKLAHAPLGMVLLSCWPEPSTCLRLAHFAQVQGPCFLVVDSSTGTLAMHVAVLKSSRAKVTYTHTHDTCPLPTCSFGWLSRAPPAVPTDSVCLGQAHPIQPLAAQQKTNHLCLYSSLQPMCRVHRVPCARLWTLAEALVHGCLRPLEIVCCTLTGNGPRIGGKRNS